MPELHTRSRCRFGRNTEVKTCRADESIIRDCLVIQTPAGCPLETALRRSSTGIRADDEREREWEKERERETAEASRDLLTSSTSYAKGYCIILAAFLSMYNVFKWLQCMEWKNLKDPRVSSWLKFAYSILIGRRRRPIFIFNSDWLRAGSIKNDFKGNTTNQLNGQIITTRLRKYSRDGKCSETELRTNQQLKLNTKTI